MPHFCQIVALVAHFLSAKLLWHPTYKKNCLHSPPLYTSDVICQLIYIMLFRKNPNPTILKYWFNLWAPNFLVASDQFGHSFQSAHKVGYPKRWRYNHRLLEAAQTPSRLKEAALHESATHCATLLPNCGTCGTLFERHTFVAHIHLINVAGIHVGLHTGPALNYYFAWLNNIQHRLNLCFLPCSKFLKNLRK